MKPLHVYTEEEDWSLWLVHVLTSITSFTKSTVHCIELGDHQGLPLHVAYFIEETVISHLSEKISLHTQNNNGQGGHNNNFNHFSGNVMASQQPYQIGCLYTIPTKSSSLKEA